MALVHLAQSSNEYLTTAAAIASHGMPNLTGQTVLIEVNCVCTNPSPYATHPEVVHATIDACIIAGATVGNITVAGRSDPGWNTDSSFAASGITTIISNTGVNYLDYADGSYTTVTPASATHWPSGLSIAAITQSTNYHIIIPVAKNHLFNCNFTAAIKLMQGPLSQANREYSHDDLAHRLPEIWFAATPNLIVLDCTHVCLTNGPFGIGSSADPMTVVVTTDPVAADATAMAILKRGLVVESVTQSQFDGDVWAQGVISYAAGLIGITGASQYTYVNDGVVDISYLLSYLGVSENPESTNIRSRYSLVNVDDTIYSMRRIH